MASANPVALALQKRVRRNGRAYAHGIEAAAAAFQNPPNPLERCILIKRGICESSFSTILSPDADQATTSVNVPPRSIANVQPFATAP